MKRAVLICALLALLLAGCGGNSPALNAPTEHEREMSQAIQACQGHGGIAYINFGIEGDRETIDELRCAE